MLKNSIFIIFLFFPLAIYSQNLKIEDIDIFITHYEKIYNVLVRRHPANSDWENYYWLWLDNNYNVMKLIMENNNISINDIEKLKIDYVNFMNCIPPNELMEIFELMGWGNNGQRKFSTIFIICNFIDYYNYEKENRYTENLEKINRIFMEIIGENDLNIIQANIERLNEEICKYNYRI